MPLKLKARNISTKCNWLRNSNWREADQPAIYKHDRGIKLGSTEKQLQQLDQLSESITGSYSNLKQTLIGEGIDKL